MVPDRAMVIVAHPDHKVKELWLGPSISTNHWIDIEPVIGEKIAVLRHHESQLPDLRVEPRDTATDPVRSEDD